MIDLGDLADQAGGRGMHRLEIRAAAHELAVMAAFALEQHRQGAADHRGVEGFLLAAQQRLQPLQPFGLHVFGHLLRHDRRRRAGPGAVFEGIGLGVADLVHQRQRGREIVIALAGKSDDEIRRQRQVGAAGAQPLDDAQIGCGVVLPVHRRQHAVGARLHRQMQIRHQRRHVAMGGDQIVGHVAGMGGGVADAVQPVDLGQVADQPAEAPFIRTAADLARGGAVIGIDVLAQQRDLARAAGHQAPRLAAISATGRENSAPRV